MVILPAIKALKENILIGVFLLTKGVSWKDNNIQ